MNPSCFFSTIKMHSPSDELLIFVEEKMRIMNSSNLEEVINFLIALSKDTSNSPMGVYQNQRLYQELMVSQGGEVPLLVRSLRKLEVLLSNEELSSLLNSLAVFEK